MDNLRVQDGELQKIAQELADLCQEKNAAYGNSFHVSGDFLRILYPNGVQPDQYQDTLTIARIFDKLMRIATRKDAFGESPWKDILGYALLSAWYDAKVNDAAFQAQVDDVEGKIEAVYSSGKSLYDTMTSNVSGSIPGAAFSASDTATRKVTRTMYSWDCEFLIRGDTIYPFSIGIQCEDGRQYYAVVKNLPRIQSAYDRHDWPGMRTEVIAQLPVRGGGPIGLSWDWTHPDYPHVKSELEIARDLAKFTDPSKYGRPEFWGYYGADDWNCLRILMGGLDFDNIPEGWPHHYNEIRQLQNEVGKLNESMLELGNLRAHHALNDAHNQMRLLRYYKAVQHHEESRHLHPFDFWVCRDVACIEAHRMLGL